MKHRRRNAMLLRALPVMTAAAVCAVSTITVLAQSTPARIEPLDITASQDSQYAGEDRKTIIICTEIKEAVPAPLNENEGVKEDAERGTFKAASDGSGISASDQEMLLRLAMAEAEDQGTEGMALVMRVVLNRVEDEKWPDSIHDVIYQKSQFEVISNGRYNRVTPDAGCYEALNMVMNGWDESQGAEYFCMSGSSKWHEKHLTRLYQYKDHVFYK